MRVAMYYSNRDVRTQEMPIPEICHGEILLKVRASGICGSDVMEWYRIKRAPLVLGHEVTGEISKVGEGVNYKLGDRIFVSHHVPCNKCHYCKNGHHTACETLHKTNFYPGGFSEYIRVPKINVDNGVYPLPDNISFEDGTFIEPLACVIRGQRLANIQKEDTVLIIGSGVSGLLHLQLAKAIGVGKIFATDINEFRLNMAKKFGADEVINAKEDIPSIVRKLNENKLADKVIVCAGALPAGIHALKSVDRGGSILFFAVPEPGIDLPVPINEFWRNEITLMTSYGAGPDDLKYALEIISKNMVNVHNMITHRLKLEEASQGFRIVSEAKESMKVILFP